MLLRQTSLALLIFPAFGWATTIEIVQPCSGQIALHRITAGKNVAEATVTALKAAEIPFEGTAQGGISSILRTPTGLDAIEVISDEDMRSYGWCFEVNGVQPNVMPEQFAITGTEHIKWFYGSALYKAGSWVSYCDPSTGQTPVELCGQPRD